MGKITGLPQALSFDEGDVLVKDGEHGTKQIPVSEAAKYMGRDTIMINEQPTEGTKVVIQTTGQEYSLALMSDVDAVDDKAEEVKTQLDDTNDLLLYFNDLNPTGNIAGIGFGERKLANKITSAPILVFGDSVTIATSNNSIKFALAKGDGSANISTWKTSSTVSTKDQWTNGLSLWIQYSDNSDIADADIDSIISSFTVTYDAMTVKDQVLKTNHSAYVATTGNDSTGDGSEINPFATVNKALECGYSDILISGGKYKQKIDLSKHRGTIKLSAYGRITPVFIDPDVEEITSATQYNGVVYSADCDNAALENITWIFQDGINDASTQITVAERMPQQRGRQYRCTDTKITRCSSTILSDAIAEIQEATNYKFFADTANNKLYFSSPSTDFSNHPICFGSEGALLFENGSAENTLIITGIECKYIIMNLNYTVDSVVSECKASCAYAPTLGQFIWDYANNTEFYSCEACLSCGKKTTSDGDGFNSHFDIGEGADDAFAHLCGVKLYNCWAHDNRDDGYSEHQRAESFIVGGLYEYNGKGGVTPSYGCHTECVGVVARKNYNGFVCCMGASNAENGIGTQLLCIDCTAYDNDGTNTGYGFVCYSVNTEATHNTMICIRCSAYNNLRCGFAIGQQNTQTMDYGKLIDCKASNNGVSAYRAYGTIEIITNTDVVSV